MQKRFLAANGFWQDEVLGTARILIGLFMIYHGWEVLDATKMNNYSKWLAELRFPASTAAAYLGKGTELVSGIFLLLGFATRPAALAMAVTMAVICFGMGKGRIFMEDQHPFLFVLFGFVFFFTGPGSWSMDRLLFEKNRVR